MEEQNRIIVLKLEAIERELAYLEKQFKYINEKKQNIDFNDIRVISDKKILDD